MEKTLIKNTLNLNSEWKILTSMRQLKMWLLPRRHVIMVPSRLAKFTNLKWKVKDSYTLYFLRCTSVTPSCFNPVKWSKLHTYIANNSLSLTGGKECRPHSIVTSLWHFLWTNSLQLMHLYPCRPSPQILSVQMAQWARCKE